MTSTRRARQKGRGRSQRTSVSVSPIELSELKAILAHAKAGPLGDVELGKLEAAVDTLAFLTRELEAKGASIARLRRMLFGPSTEKTSQIVRPKGDAPGAGDTSGNSDPVNAAQEEGTPSPVPAEDGTSPTSPSAAPDTDSLDSPAAGPTDSSTTKPKRKGHGRTPASAYTGAERVGVHHECVFRRHLNADSDGTRAPIPMPLERPFRRT